MQEEDPAGHCGKICIQQYCSDSRTQPSFPKCVHAVRCSAAARDVATKGSIPPWDTDLCTPDAELFWEGASGKQISEVFLPENPVATDTCKQQGPETCTSLF